MIDEYEFIESPTMEREIPFHPITKNPLVTAPETRCIIDKKYETGIIICDEKKENKRKWILSTIASSLIIAFTIFFFSLKYEFEFGGTIPILPIIFSPIGLIFIVLIIIIIITIVKR